MDPMRQTAAVVDTYETLEVVTDGDTKPLAKEHDSRSTIGSTGAVLEVVTVAEGGFCVVHASKSGTISSSSELQLVTPIESTLKDGAAGCGSERRPHTTDFAAEAAAGNRLDAHADEGKTSGSTDTYATERKLYKDETEEDLTEALTE